MPAAAVATSRPEDRSFSADTTAATRAIQARFIMPSSTRTSISDQQQPRQNAPCRMPAWTVPSRPRLSRPVLAARKARGDRHWRRQACLTGVSCQSPATASRTAPARTAAGPGEG
jgi:hypothetical protein